ncbi:GAF and ANTAR domain-containing protein [Janibacter alittae]|uniref:GAF and ANTAR domain-containing protein n=1 Tax=Janibacter alittae TaxID=3115209 RepID=A0ABZ2MGH5_9MICO
MNDEDETVLFATIARDLASETSEQGVLDAVVDMAVDLVPGCDDAGIMLLTKRQKVATPAATSQRVRDSDDAQAEFGEGPCYDASHAQEARNQAFHCPSTRTDTRWPRYLPRARELGVGGMLGFQLFNHQHTFGALNLYSDREHALGVVSESRGWVLASHAAVALTAARTSRQLHAALENARTIGQAVGMVRARYDMSEEQATSVLLRMSQENNVKMSDLAESVVTRGDLSG